MKSPTIEFEECILCEVCVEVAPLAFQLTEHGYIQVLPLMDYSDERIHEAIINCPKDCILWE